MRNRPRRDRQELAPVRGDGEGKALPERIRYERHDWMEQPQGVIEDVSEHRAGDFAVGRTRSDSSFRRLEVPVGNLIPDEPSRRL